MDDGIIPTGVMTDGDIVDSLANACERPTVDEFEDDTPFPTEVSTASETQFKKADRMEIIYLG